MNADIRRITVTLTRAERESLRHVLDYQFAHDARDLTGVVGNNTQKLKTARRMYEKIVNALESARKEPRL
jgi:hypothetical protein